MPVIERLRCLLDLKSSNFLFRRSGPFEEIAVWKKRREKERERRERRNGKKRSRFESLGSIVSDEGLSLSFSSLPLALHEIRYS